MTRLPSGIWKPPSIRKTGYPGIFSRGLSLIEYVVYHSAEGWAGNIMNIQNDPNRQASWPATVLLDGTLWEHYEIEDVCWISGGPVPNIKGYGVEFEGMKGTPITDAQVNTAVFIYESLALLCPNLKGPSLGQGFEEHRRVAPGSTSCPNDRIRWPDIAAGLTQEEHMGLTDDQSNKLNTMFAKVEEMWTAMFGNERDSIEKAQHREIIAKIDQVPSGGGSGEHQHTVHVTIDPT